MNLLVGRQDPTSRAQLNVSPADTSVSRHHFTLEVRPIIGVRNADYEFIVNPIIDAGFGRLGELDFAPAARLEERVAPKVRAQ